MNYTTGRRVEDIYGIRRKCSAEMCILNKFIENIKRLVVIFTGGMTDFSKIIYSPFVKAKAFFKSDH